MSKFKYMVVIKYFLKTAMSLFSSIVQELFLFYCSASLQRLNSAYTHWQHVIINFVFIGWAVKWNILVCRPFIHTFVIVQRENSYMKLQTTILRMRITRRKLVLLWCLVCYFRYVLFTWHVISIRKGVIYTFIKFLFLSELLL